MRRCWKSGGGAGKVEGAESSIQCARDDDEKARKMVVDLHSDLQKRRLLLGIKWISLRVALRRQWNGPQKTEVSCKAMLIFSKGSNMSRATRIVTRARVPNVLSRMMKRSLSKMRWRGKNMRMKTRRSKRSKKPRTLRWRIRVAEWLRLRRLAEFHLKYCGPG